METKQIEEVLENLLSTGGDFAEVFIEDKKTKVFQYINQALESVQISHTNGVGLRLAKEENTYYAATNDFRKENINQIVDELKKNIDETPRYQKICLETLVSYSANTESHYSDEEIKQKLKDLDYTIRQKEKRIEQVNLVLQNEIQHVTIANHTGLYKSECRVRSRFFMFLNMKDKEKVSRVYFNKAAFSNFDFLDTIDFQTEIDTLIKQGLDKLYAKPCVGGQMPVIITPGFGAVIFHEACGHAMEATAVANHASVLADDLNQKIASEKVTIIDDGSLEGEWGSTKIDDEGMPTQKNVLIEKGILKSFFIDSLNNRKMKQKTTGSGRRESYRYAPTSRMNNTYLLAGTDTFDEMIKDVKLGLYAVKMGGGCASTETGEFNFGVDFGYMIRDGKIAECVTGATLIGNTKEILNEVEMVGKDFAFGSGLCGSISGNVPVNTGQPTIKIRNILVGGES